MTDLFLLGAAGLLMAAAISDVRCYRIPNTLCAALAVLFAVRAILAGPPFPFGHLIPATLVFAIGLVLFVRNLMGGGDVKLLAAAVLWIPPAFVLRQITGIALSGAVLALLLLLARGIARHGAFARDGDLPLLLQDKAPVPYGVAIALGTIAYLPVA
ncbi:MAG TPA: prepilin peptidase [Azospirillum sp.]|nr:prepilin peptidase [Azospirillum sp.]